MEKPRKCKKMKENLIDIRALTGEARNSEHKEAFKILDRKHDHRIGVGTRLEPPDKQSFFLEVIVHLCLDKSQVDLPTLEKKLKSLERLQKRGYSLSCQDDNCITCEIIMPPQSLSAEYKAIESMMKEYKR